MPRDQGEENYPIRHLIPVHFLARGPSALDMDADAVLHCQLRVTSSQPSLFSTDFPFKCLTIFPKLKLPHSAPLVDVQHITGGDSITTLPTKIPILPTFVPHLSFYTYACTASIRPA